MKTLRGNIFTSEGEFRYGEIVVENSVITKVDYLDADSLTEKEKATRIIPGLVDIHTHGAFGHDTCDADYEGQKVIANYERNNGITSFCPTTMTLSEDRLTEICRNIAKVSRECPEIKGIYLEGPFISMEKKGAQNPLYIAKPDMGMIDRLCEESENLVKIVAIAPETEAAIETIKSGKDKVKFSMAHTAADVNQAQAAIEAGAKHVTHLYNAMNPYTHRAPGLIGAAMDSEDTMVELISDGIHVHPVAIKDTFRMFGEDRVILISDSMEATGMEDGNYALGGQPVTKEGRLATLSDGTIAGSASNLFDCLTYAISIGVKPESAILAATRNPAKEIGIYAKTGSIDVGKASDILILGDDYSLQMVIQSEEDF